MSEAKKFYILFIVIVAALSAYPVYMGVSALASFLQYGAIDAANYPKYVIPYAPLCAALLAVTCLMPFLYKRLKKHSLLAASVIGAAVFFACEIGLEQIKIVGGHEALAADAWQYSLCVSTPEVLKSLGEPIYAQNNPAYKIHFYLIALVIMLAAINVIYGYTKMRHDNDYRKKRAVDAQLVCVAVFSALCVLACFTAFYRNGTLDISPLSSALMSVFFVVFGMTAGVYLATMLYGKEPLLSAAVPSMAAVAITVAMYCGELILTGGVLFRFGTGAFFEPFAGPFAPVDIAVILLSGVVTFITALLLNGRRA